MFPIPKNMYERLQYKDIDKHRTFSSETEKINYISLLQLELKAINSMNIEKAAIKLYANKYSNPNSILAKRCIDFKAMEKLAFQYNNINGGGQNNNTTEN